MAKKFNITGLCIPEWHYMVDISGRVDEIRKMVEDGEYFTINRPRQYGKTTTLNCLSRALAGEYAVIDTSFEGTGDSLFATEEDFCSQIFEIFAYSMEITDGALAERLLHYQKDIIDFKTLSAGIKNLIKETGKGIVLLIDEVDKSSDNKVFLRFLGMLRNKYLARAAGKDITFQSVVLAGVHDVKNLKLAIHGESDVLEGGGARFNSPWNIAVQFDIDMSFSVPDIETMLTEYREDNSLDFDTAEIAAEIRRLTSGYPYLVSALCLTIDKKLNRDWTLSGVENAAKKILKGKSTLADDVIKNVENNPEIKRAVIAMLFEGQAISFNLYKYEQGILYGIFIERDGRLTIHNQLFEEMLYAFLIEDLSILKLAQPLLTKGQGQFTETGRLDMEKVLRKFREFMREEYRSKDDKFYETNGRLLFLVYLRPVINGRGFALVEPETRDNRRMDIVVTYGDEKFVIELKIWHGAEYEQKGLSQLAGYLDAQSMGVGWLVTFGLGKMADTAPEWVKADGKDIFKVIV
jgi:hypothetical protein